MPTTTRSNNPLRSLQALASSLPDELGDFVSSCETFTGHLCDGGFCGEGWGRANHEAYELRRLLDTASSPIFGIDTQGNVSEWNGETAAISQYSASEAIGKPFVATFLAPELHRSFQHVLDDALLLGKNTSNYRLEIRTRSDGVRHLLVSVSTRRDAAGNIVGVAVVAQDVTESTKRDREVAAVANELRQLIEKANAPIFGIDSEGRVNEWNEKTAEITGFAKDEAFGRPLVSTFIVPSLRKSVQEVLDEALQGRETSNYPLEFRTKSDEVRHLLVNATTRRDVENRIVGVVGVAQDVTESTRREREVAAMANELRQLVDTANAPIFGVDIQGRINEWNNKTVEITGFDRTEAMGVPLVSTFIVPSLRQSIQQVMDDALKGKETSNYELEIETKSKEIRCLLVNATTRRDAENNIVGVVGVAQDVTDDRRHARELHEMQSLQASQAARVETERNMTAYFAHELRNPLSAIDGALAAMPDVGLPTKVKNLTDVMRLCTSFMSSIMNNLLDVRKMEEGQMVLKRETLSLSETLDNVHKMLSSSVRPGVTFTKDCRTRDRDWVLGDSHRLQQVLTNIITNAIKYTASGSIVLKMRWEGDKLRFECIDTGPGIPPEDQEKIFERFVKRGGAPGTGLGLAISKHLVDLMDGSIWYESDPSSRPGTTCVVTLPLVASGAPDVVVDENNSQKLLEEPISFLLVDDIKVNRSMLRLRIKKGIAPNAVITEASTGEEALNICESKKFDVIVTDHYMEEAGGVMVGTDVVIAMRRSGMDSIIVGCSGNEMDDLFESAGADWVWRKPLPKNEQILNQLRTALKKKQERRDSIERRMPLSKAA